MEAALAWRGRDGLPHHGRSGDLHHLRGGLCLLLGQEPCGITPREVLTLPIFATVCLLSSSATVHYAVSSLRAGKRATCSLLLAATVALGSLFLGSTALEWHHLIFHDGLSIRTNLFGTTFYSLVGLHATHVVVGLFMLALALLFSLRTCSRSSY